MLYFCYTIDTPSDFFKGCLQFFFKFFRFACFFLKRLYIMNEIYDL